MSFINILANNQLLEDLEVKDNLSVGNQSTLKKLQITDNITLSETGSFSGKFINDFVESLDDDTTETIDLYEKIQRIDTRINNNSTAHINNAGAISSRYTKTEADNKFATKTNAQFTGDISIRENASSQYETLNDKLASKVDSTTLTTNHYTKTEMNTKLTDKADADDLNNHALKLNPSFKIVPNWIPDSEGNKTKHELECFSVNIDPILGATAGGSDPYPNGINSTLKEILDDNYAPKNTTANGITQLNTSKLDKTNPAIQTSATLTTDPLLTFKQVDAQGVEVETKTLKELLDAKIDGGSFYTQTEVDDKFTDTTLTYTGDSYVTFSKDGVNTTLKSLLDDKLTTTDLPTQLTGFAPLANPSLTGTVNVNGINIETLINSKISSTDPSFNTTNDSLITFTGNQDTTLKALLDGKLDDTALDNTVVTTNTITNPTFIGDISFKETVNDTAIELVGIINEKAPLNNANMTGNFKVNSKEILNKPSDYGNNTLAQYIALKAPTVDTSDFLTTSDLPDTSGFLTTSDLPDTSGFFTLPANTTQSEFEQLINTMSNDNRWQTLDIADLLVNKIDKPSEFDTYGFTLETYIEAKAPTTDISGKVDKPTDWATAVSGNSDPSLSDYIGVKAPATDISGKLDTPSDWTIDDTVTPAINHTLESYIQAKAPSSSSAIGAFEIPLINGLYQLDIKEVEKLDASDDYKIVSVFLYNDGLMDASTLIDPANGNWSVDKHPDGHDWGYLTGLSDVNDISTNVNPSKYFSPVINYSEYGIEPTYTPYNYGGYLRLTMNESTAKSVKVIKIVFNTTGYESISLVKIPLVSELVTIDGTSLIFTKKYEITGNSTTILLTVPTLSLSSAHYTDVLSANEYRGIKYEHISGLDNELYLKTINFVSKPTDWGFTDTLETYVDNKVASIGGSGSSSSAVVLQIVASNVHEIRSYYSNYVIVLPMRIHITPTSTNSKILIKYVVNYEAGENASFKISRDGTVIGYNVNMTNNNANGIATSAYDLNVDSTPENTVVEFVDTPNTTNQVYYDLIVHSYNYQFFYFNRAAHWNYGNTYYEVGVSFKSATEIAA